MRFFRPTLRVRMALLYGGLVLLVGVSLLCIGVILLEKALTKLPGYDKSSSQLAVMRDGKAHVLTAAEIKHAQNGATAYLLHSGLVLFAVILVVATTGGYLLARQALRPIAKLTQTARALSTENLDQRINLAGPDDELRELAETFDQMLTRLDAAFDSQRLFVANASHELRTPLSVIRTELEVTLSDPDADPVELRRMGGVVASATERAQRLVASLLTLARLQAVGGGALEVDEPVDLALIVPGAVSAVEAEAAEKGVRVETEVEPALASGDPRLLERLIGNLVENAIRHNVPGGWLRITTGQSTERVWVHVANGGTVVTGDVNALFEPFRRGGRLRTATRGAGLGLAIVRMIVDAHRGKLQAAAPPFGGLTVRIELPRAQTPPHSRVFDTRPAGITAGRARV